MKIEIKRIEILNASTSYECVVCGSYKNLCGVFSDSGIIDISSKRCDEYYCPLVICEKCLKKMLESFTKLKGDENEDTDKT